MSPLGTYAAFLWDRLDGPRAVVVAMAIIAGLSSGLGIAAINAGIETWAAGVVPWGALGLFVLSQALWVVTAYYAQFQAARMVAGLMYGMRNAASRRVAEASLRAVEDQSHGRILAMLQHDTRAIGESVFASIIALRSVVLVLFAMVYLTQLSWVVAILAVLSVAMGVTAYVYQQSRMKGFMTKARATEAEYFDAVDDLLRGGKEARFFDAGQEAHLRRIDRLGVLGRNLTARWEFLGFTGRSIAHVALLAALGLLAFLPPQTISATGVPVFQAVTVMLYLVSGIELIVDAAHPITMGRVAHREYSRIWDALPPESPTAELAEIRRAPITLRARGMTYTHVGDEGRFTLGPIDLDLSAPELVFITGGNGSGKTTLLKCLTGLYTPDGGELRFMGERVVEQNAALLRWSVATVFHDYHLFARLYGHRLGEKRARVNALLERFELAHKVDLGPLGFTSTRLSTGQKKRLGLIAALLLDRPVLVLDEFGAEQDPEFRDRFYREILPELRDEGRLIIAVTHDDRYFGVCDRRIHLDYGRIKINQPDAVTVSSAKRSGGEDPVQWVVGAEDRA